MTKTAYKKALRTGSVIDVTSGLDAGIDVDLEVEQGLSALQLSVQRGHAQLVKLLVERKADINRCDSPKKTPLDLALDTGNPEVVKILRVAGGKVFSDIVKERVEQIRDQSWSQGFGWRTLKALAEDNIVDEECFLTYQSYHSHPLSVWNDVGRRQRELKLQHGLIQPDEPLDAEQVENQKAKGGLLFRGNTAIWSLGNRKAPEGHFLCMKRGVIYFEKMKSSYQTDTAFGVLHCREMSKTNRWYGVSRRIDYDKWKDEEQLTRDIFGLCIDELESLAPAYQRAFRYHYREEFMNYKCRVTCSDKENQCDISDYYIAGNVPFLAFGDTAFFLGHISIAAFYGSVSLLTDHFDDCCGATKALLSSGLPPTLLPSCKQLVINGETHVTAAQIRDIVDAKKQIR